MHERCSIWIEAGDLARRAYPGSHDDPLGWWLLTEAIVALAFRYNANKTRSVEPYGPIVLPKEKAPGSA